MPVLPPADAHEHMVTGFDAVRLFVFVPTL